MAFVILHLNEPGRPASRTAIAIHHIISVREAADDAGTEVKLTDGTLINVTEPFKAIMEELARMGSSSEGT